MNDQERAAYPSAELERLIIDLERHKDFEGSMVLRRMVAEVARLREELERAENENRALVSALHNSPDVPAHEEEK